MEQQLQVAVRIITIQEGKVLLVSNDRDGFYYFVGGKLQFGETLEMCAQREIKEETGLDISLKLIKILYLQELVKPTKQKHKLELFILAVIDKFAELEGINDPEHAGTDHLTWVSVDNLPDTLFPKEVAQALLVDYKNNFSAPSLPHFISTV